jgi:hypothetical protein
MDEDRERSPVASRRLLSCVLPALSLTTASGHIAVVSRRRSARAYPRKVVQGEPRAGLLLGAHTSGNVPAELGTAQRSSGAWSPQGLGSPRTIEGPATPRPQVGGPAREEPPPPRHRARPRAAGGLRLAAPERPALRLHPALLVGGLALGVVISSQIAEAVSTQAGTRCGPSVTTVGPRTHAICEVVGARGTRFARSGSVGSAGEDAR